MTLSLIAYALAAAGAPAHAIDIQHRGVNYDVEYHAVVESRAKPIMAGPPSRPHSRRCAVTATVSVERHIAGPNGGAALQSMIGETKTYQHNAPGYCTKVEEKTARLTAAKSDDIARFLASAAETNRPAALAAIEAAHTLAAN